MRSSLVIGLCLALVEITSAQGPLPKETRAALERERAALQHSLAALPRLNLVSGRVGTHAEHSDAEVFLRGLEWALRYDREFTPADVALLQKAVVRARERIDALAKSSMPWQRRHGKVVLGHYSRIDGSVQPYGVVIPKSYDFAAGGSVRLDVVLHGSMKPVGMSELRFMARFDEGDQENSQAVDAPYIELHPLGRVENAYRWAGETDVFEAIQDVCQRYRIDHKRIVLRGMSMGASGTWHLGLKHPSRFVALGPYCGYVDTRKFSESLPSFVRVGELPVHQDLGLHMLDSMDYAANASMVPAIACMGEKDPFFQAHVLMDAAMKREGLKMVNLISPGTGHKIDPVTHAEQMRRIAEHVERGLDTHPSKLRFVTWTLKYSRCHWLQILGLEKHYERAEFAAEIRGDVLEIAEPKNIAAFLIETKDLPTPVKEFRIGGAKYVLPSRTPVKQDKSSDPERVTDYQRNGTVRLERDGRGSWREPGGLSRGKRPDLQGPIDDAFCTPFVCVRGTGKAWNPAAGAYAEASLKRFADEWHHYMRGNLPIKNDTEVTEEDARSRNMILFGDPGSNTWIAKALPGLPLKWTKESFQLMGAEYASAQHVPVLITRNHLAGGQPRYLVLNSGQTFHEAELSKLNYLLFPRWGDWAALKIVAEPKPGEPLEEVVRAGYFDEQWEGPRR